jgi:hypothetical protein
MDSKSHYPDGGVKSQRDSDPTAQDNIPPSSVSHQPGIEICDVCGYVNRGYALVCGQCDVPLPSSVISFKVRGR